MCEKPSCCLMIEGSFHNTQRAERFCNLYQRFRSTESSVNFSLKNLYVRTSTFFITFMKIIKMLLIIKQTKVKYVI